MSTQKHNAREAKDNVWWDGVFRIIAKEGIIGQMSSRRKQSPSWAKYKDRKRRNRKDIKYVQGKHRIDLLAPKNFSILTNRSAVLRYFHRVMKNIHERQDSLMNMGDIAKTDLATIAIVISMMMDRRNKEALIRRYVDVKIPIGNSKPAELFRKAKFGETVTQDGNAEHSYFLSRRDTKINNAYMEDIEKYANDFLSVEKAKYLMPILVELMKNTNNHATPDEDKDENYSDKELDNLRIPWFISIVEDESTGKLIFSLVDLGIGIMESLQQNGLVTTDSLFEDPIKDMYDNSQSKFLLHHIPKGVSSSTGLSYRGQGLKKVFDLANKGNYGTFRLVTNKAALNLVDSNDKVIDTAESFGGTVYYWEMSK